MSALKIGSCTPNIYLQWKGQRKGQLVGMLCVDRGAAKASRVTQTSRSLWPLTYTIGWQLLPPFRLAIAATTRQAASKVCSAVQVTAHTSGMTGYAADCLQCQPGTPMAACAAHEHTLQPVSEGRALCLATNLGNKLPKHQ
jgi:hypothetical protein